MVGQKHYLKWLSFRTFPQIQETQWNSSRGNKKKSTPADIIVTLEKIKLQANLIHELGFKIPKENFGKPNHAAYKKDNNISQQNWVYSRHPRLVWNQTIGRSIIAALSCYRKRRESIRSSQKMPQRYLVSSLSISGSKVGRGWNFLNLTNCIYKKNG